ncbi:MAG TPA: CocE/NonD family hydrolase [Acidimicrobiales bacterium]|nr:CocE/NonD family hydrolase [Acidimicrobiales bacterium]
MSDLAWWMTPPPPADPGFIRSSVYLPMRDGVRIALDVYLPTSLGKDDTVPAMLWQTRYFRRYRFRPWAEGLGTLLGKMSDIRRFVAAGYAFVAVDVRGTGASFGWRDCDNGPEEARDMGELCDWIVSQPWSDGVIGASGVSYEGSTAEHLLRSKHPAVKAIATQFSSFDGYDDILRPGGALNHGFFATWSALVRAKDANVEEAWLEANATDAYKMLATMTLGVAPVDDDPDGALLAEAVAEHARNYDIVNAYFGREFRDDAEDVVSPAGFLDDIRASGAAVYSWSGWYDGGYANSAIKRWAALRENGARLLLGPWNHGGGQHVFGDGVMFDVTGELLRFFDHHLRGIEAGVADEEPLHWFTIGEGWKAGDTWPPVGFEAWNLPLGDGVDTYAVDFTASSGPGSRWAQANFGGHTIGWPDRAEQDAKLLVYDVAMLDSDVEITGHARIDLVMACDSPDTLVKAYLEEVKPDGEIRHITEGQLVASHRALADPRWETFGPWPSHRRADARPLMPGEEVEMTFALLPISYLARKGSRLRIALSGADDGIFARVPLDGPPPVWEVNAAASSVTVPINRR